MGAAVVVIVALLCVVICHTMARKRGLNPVLWGVMGAIFGPLAIPFVFLVKPKTGEGR